MSLVNKNSIFGPNNIIKNPLEEELTEKRSVFTPLKYRKYDTSNLRVIGGSRQPINITPPAPEPPPPPALGAFSNAFSNAFNV